MRGNCEQIADAARQLARFHRAGLEASLPAGKQWPRYDSPQKIREGLAALRQDEHARPFADDLDFAAAQTAALEQGLPDEAYWALPRYIIHGDYHPANIKFLRNRVSGIFDLDWASRQPRLRDLADGIIFFAGRRDRDIDGANIYSLTQTFHLTDALAHRFLDPYLQTETLTPEEQRALPHFLRARWLYCRVSGMAKVPPEQRADYFFAGLRPPLEWIAVYEHRLQQAL